MISAFKTRLSKPGFQNQAFKTRLSKPGFQNQAFKTLAFKTTERLAAVNVQLMRAILGVDNILVVNGGPNAGASLVLYRRMILIPDNLEALCKMCDPSVRTGEVRGTALILLTHLCNVRSIWSIKMHRGETSFAFHAMRAMQFIMHPDAKQDSGIQVECFTYAWSTFTAALNICGDHPHKIAHFLAQYDWKALLDSPNEDAIWDWRQNHFESLHARAVQALKVNWNDAAAKTLLYKLGSCDELFLRVLRQLSSRVFLSLPVNELCSKLCSLTITVCDYLVCLSPPPSGQNIDSLVKSARSAVSEGLELILRSDDQLDANTRSRGFDPIYSALRLIEENHWQILKRENEDAKWKRFQGIWLEDAPPDPRAVKRQVKQIKKEHHGRLMEETENLSDGEMCANCFVLESQLDHKLHKCKQCLQIKYCSRACQREHWKKAHRQQCKMQTST